MKQETSTRLQAAQQLLLKYKQQEGQIQSPNYTQVIVTYQKYTFKSIIGKEPSIQNCPTIKFLASNDVLISEIAFRARKSFNIPPNQALFFFSQGNHIIANIYTPVKNLKSKQHATLRLFAKTSQIF